MITLIKYAPAFGLADASPFCLKADLLLKMSGLPYKAEIAGDPRRGPKGKLPAIVDGGVTLGDSEIIRWHLELKHGADFDKGLGEAERARAHAFARMLEERTYWVLIYSRWMEPDIWPVFSRQIFAGLPPVVRTLIPPIARRKVRGYLHAHGLGRHSRDEIYRMGAADLRAVSVELGDKPFFTGADPRGIDATVYGIVASVVEAPLETPLKAAALQHQNLVAYCKRMRERFYT